MLWCKLDKSFALGKCHGKVMLVHSGNIVFLHRTSIKISSQWITSYTSFGHYIVISGLLVGPLEANG